MRFLRAIRRSRVGTIGWFLFQLHRTARRSFDRNQTDTVL